MTYQLLIASVRGPLASRVIQSLIDAGCKDLFIHPASRVLPGLDRSSYDYSVQLGQGFEPMIRLEAVGLPDEINRWTSAIRAAGSTGRHGDGIVCVISPAAYLHISEGAAGPVPEADSRPKR